MSDIAKWLQKHGLGTYVDTFLENEIELEDVADLTDGDLRELGLPMGPRKRLLRLSATPAPPRGDDAAQAPDSSATASLAGSRPVEAERRQLTIMFADLVDSTRLSTRLDPEDLRELTRQYQDTAKAAVEQFGGFVARYMGDGVLAYFGYPIAHEDDAERAVRSALDLVQRLGLAPTVVPVNVRIGVATGQVIVGDLIGEGASRENAVVGETPNLAARLQSIAQPGEVAIDGVTHAITTSIFHAERRAAELKGFDESTTFWVAGAERRGETRFAASVEALSGFVGRDHELGLLLERWEMSVSGTGHVALVSGEPGIGKSRLTEQLHERIGREGHHVRLRYQCSPFHSLSPFYPIVAHLKHAAAFADSDTLDERLDKIEALASTDNRETHALLADLLSVPYETRYGALQMTAAVQKQRTLAALVDELVAIARARPVLFVFEDAHWIDSSTHELIREAVAATADVPVMMVITHRPGWNPGIAEHPRMISMPLSRLVARHAADLAGSVAENAMSGDLIREIVERAEGIPLFIEELTKALVERSAEPGRVDIPATLQASLTERIDRLGAAKEAAQAASVIGREFDADMLAMLLDCTVEEATISLEAMADVGLIHPRGNLGAERYLWKHALVQDVAYASLLRDRRKDLHRRAASVLEKRRLQAPAAAEPTLLAHHYRGAGLPAEAARNWLRAAHASLGYAASDEIIAQARNALVDLERVDDERSTRGERSRAHALIGEAMMAGRGFGSADVREPLETALELARAAEDMEAEYEALRALGPYLLSTQGGKVALRGASRMLEIVESSGDEKKRLAALDAAGTAYFLLGEQRKAEDALETAVGLVDGVKYARFPTKGGADVRIPMYGYLGLVLGYRGKTDRAAAVTAKALSVARRQSHPLSMAWALTVAGRASIVRGDFSQAEAALDEAIAICDSHDLMQRKGHALALRGRLLARSGRPEEALQDIDAGLELWRQGGTLFHTSEYLADGAAARLALGNTIDARQWLSEAEHVETSVAEMFNAAERLRLCARCLVLDGDTGLALEILHSAVELASSQGAHLVELRCHCDRVTLVGDAEESVSIRGRLAECLELCAHGGPAPEVTQGRALLKIKG